MSDSERKHMEREIYDRKANMERPAYHTFWDTDLYRAMHGFEFDPKVEELGDKYLRGRKVLVLGAGRIEVRDALKFTRDVHALNISQRIVDELQRLFPTVRSFVGDAENLDVSETYDVVLCKSILHHLHPIERVIASTASVLKPGGYLVIIAEPGLLNPFAAVARYLSPSQEHTPGERPFVFSTFTRLLRKHFEEVEAHYYFLGAMLWPYLARKFPKSRQVASAMLKPTLRMESLLRHLPAVKNLCWVTTGVYRKR